MINRQETSPLPSSNTRRRVSVALVSLVIGCALLVPGGLSYPWLQAAQSETCENRSECQGAESTVMLENGVRHGAKKGSRPSSPLRTRIDVSNQGRGLCTWLLVVDRTDCWISPLRC